MDFDKILQLRDEYQRNPDQFKNVDAAVAVAVRPEKDDALRCAIGCGSILTISDPGNRCRQCVLEGRR